MTTLRAGAVTDTGRARAVNQDSLLVVDGKVYAVADGMGGHRGGEVASALALESLAGNLQEPSIDSLVAGVGAANDAVHGRSSQEPDLRGMGTTLVAIAVVVGRDGSERLAMANVGDSRAYRLRDGALEQLTEDHSLVESLVRQGRISPEEAATHPQRNIITRALGVEPKVEVDSWEMAAVPGDRFLLCSDGLFNEVDSATIAATLGRLDDPTEAGNELVRLANEGGGRDNITCVIVDVLDGAGSAAEPVLRVATASEPDLTAYGPPTEPNPVSVFADEQVAPAPPPPPPPPTPTPVAPTGPIDQPQDEAGEAPPLIGAIPDHLPDDDEQPAPVVAKRRRVTWRVVMFFGALIALVVVVIGAVRYYASSTYFVAFDAQQHVTIFQGRPDGFAGIDPTVVRVTDISQDDLDPLAAEPIANKKEEGSRDAAEEFIDNLCSQLQPNVESAECTGTTSTTTTSTTEPSTSHTSSDAGPDTTKPDSGTQAPSDSVAGEDKPQPFSGGSSGNKAEPSTVGTA